MKLYHGTSADNLVSILKNGFNSAEKGNELWIVSDGGNYFWDAKALADSEGSENEIAIGKQRAFESAEFGLTRAKNCRRIVFEIEISQDEFELLFNSDESCPNMDCAVVAHSPISPGLITRYWIDKDDLSFFRPYFASLSHGRDLAVEIEFTRAELTMIKSIESNSEIFEFLSELQCEAREVAANQELAPA